MNRYQVGVVQSTPVFFDLPASLQKIEAIIAQQAAAGVKLLLFPESYLPGYPRGFDFGAVIGQRLPVGRDAWLAFWKNSVPVPGAITQQLAAWAKSYDLLLVMGVTERDELNGSLYCTLLYFDPVQGLIGKHRKLKATGTERLVWAEGSAEDLQVFPTGLGRLGGLICWENLMPLARMALYLQGIQVYLAPTADARPTWTPILQHIAQEGRCYVLGANQYFRRTDYPEPWRELIQLDHEDLCRGGSAIISPLGEIMAGPLWDAEGVLTAELSLDEVVRSRLDFAPAGHYHRPDLFEFKVKT
jgi:nitrilase